MYFSQLSHSDIFAVKRNVRSLILKTFNRVFAMSKDTHRAGGKQSLHEFWYVSSIVISC